MPANVDNTTSYVDIESLAKLRAQAKDNPGLAKQKVAQEFESLFIKIMLKSMRSASDMPHNERSGSSGVSLYQDIFDGQVSITAAKRGGIGIAQALLRQMSDLHGSNPPPSVGSSVSRSAVMLGAQETTKIKSAIDSVSFSSPEEFVRSVKDAAVEAAKKLGVDPDLLIAQSALETGWGRHVLNTERGVKSLNMFNIKSGSAWKGETVGVNALEFKDGVASRELSSFRVYNSIRDSFKDFVDFVRSNGRYSEAIANAGDPEKFIKGLHRSGYATDPEYSTKVLRVYNQIKSTPL